MCIRDRVGERWRMVAAVLLPTLPGDLGDPLLTGLVLIGDERLRHPTDNHGDNLVLLGTGDLASMVPLTSTTGVGSTCSVEPVGDRLLSDPEQSGNLGLCVV